MNKRDDDEILEEHIRFVHAWNQRIAKQSASIELPCICHVPPPEGTVRIEIRKPKEGEWFWSDDANEWMKAELDFENLALPVAIIAQQYIYPTPVEACRMIADAGNYVLCEFLSSHGEWCPGKLRWGEVETTGVVPMPYCILNYGWVEKIRVPKPKP